MRNILFQNGESGEMFMVIDSRNKLIDALNKKKEKVAMAS
jgi:hypothetical protein